MADFSRPLLVVDGDNLTHRAYHSIPKNEPDRKQTNAIRGFFGMLLRITAEEQPRGIFIAWDTLGVETYRNQLWPPYQGGREFDDSIIEQLEVLPGLCKSCGLAIGKVAGYEADDLMAAAALAEVAQGGTALILTTDKDTYQLVNSSITVISPQRGTRELARIGPQEVFERMGVRPEQVPDFKALAGDPSDKIPGMRGCGPKTAASMLAAKDTLDEIVAEWEDDRRYLALLFREVARMRTDIPVELPGGPPDWNRGAEAIEAFGLPGLAERLREFATGAGA